MKQSKLYEVLNHMPKGGLLHLHTTSASSVEAYLELTYEECVYFNERELKFLVAPVTFEL